MIDELGRDEGLDLARQDQEPPQGADVVVELGRIDRRKAAQVADEGGEILIPKRIELVRRHEQQGLAVGPHTLTDRPFPIHVRVRRSDATLARRQIRGIELRENRHIQEGAPSEIHSVALYAPACRREVLAAGERLRVVAQRHRIGRSLIGPAETQLGQPIQEPGGQDDDREKGKTRPLEEALHMEVRGDSGNAEPGSLTDRRVEDRGRTSGSRWRGKIKCLFGHRKRGSLEVPRSASATPTCCALPIRSS